MVNKQGNERRLMINGYGITIFGILLTCLASQTIQAAEVYKQVDENGNVIFTDTPGKGAEKVDVQPTNIQNFPKATKIAPQREQPKDTFSYKTMNIIAPRNDTTIRDPGDVLVRVELSPGLQRAHQVRFTDNGEPLGEPSRKLSIQLINLSRGTHMLQAEVLDQQGKALISSAAVVVYVHRNTIINNPPPKPTTPAKPTK